MPLSCLFDQRNCGKSRPHASDPGIDLSGNTTAALVEDIERLRTYLGIDAWLVMGGSWGSTLGLAYAQAHPGRVAALVLFGVFLGTRDEFDWVFHGGLGARFPTQWDRLQRAVGATEDTDVVRMAHDLLVHEDPDTARRIAHEWCVWESSILQDPPSDRLLPLCGSDRAALAFARIVTHYVLNYAWFEDGALLEAASSIADIPTTLINGEDDPQTGRLISELAGRLRRVETVWVEDAGHAATEDAFVRAIIGATDRWAGAGAFRSGCLSDGGRGA